jgi:hypothetical protein
MQDRNLGVTGLTRVEAWRGLARRVAFGSWATPFQGRGGRPILAYRPQGQVGQTILIHRGPWQYEATERMTPYILLLETKPAAVAAEPSSCVTTHPALPWALHSQHLWPWPLAENLQVPQGTAAWPATRAGALLRVGK